MKEILNKIKICNVERTKTKHWNQSTILCISFHLNYQHINRLQNLLSTDNLWQYYVFFRCYFCYILQPNN